ncbi:insulinase family protein [Aliikangiella maris]|uniref:Protease 3 n=2 Tax=Aliikangiella maris TaxID=3162458 RepID=A0ABV2BQC9_9GAMM
MIKAIIIGVVSSSLVTVLPNAYGAKTSFSGEQLFAAQSSGSHSAKQPMIIASPNDEREYRAIKLENQIEIILVSDPSVDKSAASLSVGVGLLHDPMSQQGMAHYLEHMLFLGTERFPEANGYSEFMAKNGGNSNAYTWLEITNYMFEIKNDAYAEALDRFADFFKSPKLYKEYSEKEKSAVNAEWSMRRELDFFGQFKLNRSMMGSHPANRFLIGNLETLGDKKESELHATMVDFYNRYYSANIMKVALVSNQPLATMEKMAKQYFSDIKNKNIDKPSVEHQLNFKKLGKKRIHYVPNEDVKQMIIDFTIENNQQKYRQKPNRFLSYLMSSEMPGTPASVLKKAGLISQLNVSITPDMYGNYGQFSIDVDLTSDGMQQREKIIQVIMNYIDKIKHEGVDKKYFKEIKVSLANQFQFLEKGSAFDYVSQLSAQMQQYPIHEVISAPYTFESFNASSIQSVLEQLTPERLRIWYISQQEPHDQSMHFYNGKYKIVDIPDSEIQSWRKPSSFALNLPKVNSLLPEGFEIKTSGKSASKPELVHDEKGIKVWHLASPNFHHQPKGNLRIYINNPERLNNIEGQILLALWADLLQLELSTLTTEASIAGMNLNISVRNGMELVVSGFTDKQLVLIEKVLKKLRIKVDDKAFVQAVDRFVREIQNQEKQFPISQLFQYVRKIVTSSGYSNAQLIAAAKSIKPQVLEAFIETVLINNQIRTFAFGNYNQKDLSALVAAIQQTLPEKRKVTDYAITKIIKPETGKTLSFKKDLFVADVAVADLSIHPDPSVRQEARAEVLQNHFGTVTYDKLRTEEQLAYAVSGIATKIRQYSALGVVIQTPVKDAEAMQQRIDAFKNEYAAKLAKMTDAEFAEIKNSTLVELKEKPKNLNEEQSLFLNDWYYEEWSFDSRQKLIAEVEKVTLADIKQFYAETLGSDNAFRINIQLRGAKFKDKPFATIKDEKVIDDLVNFHESAQYQ